MNSSCDQAFRTILKNRTFHGGILAEGSGLIKVGENGKGIFSRWYPETLARRIRAIAAIRERITFIKGDGIQEMRRQARNKRTVYFIDPPYTVLGTNGKRAGTRLYTHFKVDHELLFTTAARVVGDVLLTYDDCPDVRALADAHGLETRNVAMKNTHHAMMTELLIGRDLQWLR